METPRQARKRVHRNTTKKEGKCKTIEQGKTYIETLGKKGKCHRNTKTNKEKRT